MSLLVYNFKSSYNWSVIFEQLGYKVTNFHKNLFFYQKYLPIRLKRNYLNRRWRKLYQLGFRHKVYRVLRRTKGFILKHFYLLKKPFKRFKRLNGFWYFKPYQTWLQWWRSNRYLKVYYAPKKFKPIRRRFNRFQMRTGIKCKFNRWHQCFKKSKFMKIIDVYNYKPFGWCLSAQQFEYALSSSAFKGYLKSKTRFPRFLNWVHRIDPKSVGLTAFPPLSLFNYRAHVRMHMAARMRNRCLFWKNLNLKSNI